MAVVDLIFEHARAAPGRTAVIHNGQIVSYGDFAGLIERARRFLAARGVPREREAVLCIHDIFGAWIVGLALRSLGVTTVNGRSAEDIDRLGLDAVSVVAMEGERWPGLAEAAARAGAPLIATPRTLVTALEAAPAERNQPPLADPPGGHILLTSGTTGAYKKVLVDAESELRNLALRPAAAGISRDSVVNLLDFGGWTGVGYQWANAAWGVGAAVVTHLGPDRYRSLAAPGLSHVVAHPQFLADLLAAPPEVSLRNDAVMLMVTAGALSQAQWRAARERLTTHVRTMVASTEAGVVSMTRVETPEDLAWHRPIAESEVQVVDDADRPLPPGQTGLIRMRTSGVDGYLGDPETSRAFFRDGFFYPGDLAVLRKDGRFSLQGRVTDVINVMGEKIATTPIETALQDALGAEAVCVFSAPGPGGEAIHVAIHPGRPVTPEALREALQAALPGIPEVRVHALKDFPRNHLGKIERRVLKARLLGDGA